MSSPAKAKRAANDGALENPSAIARDALHELAALRLPPTPDNYAKVYHRLAQAGEGSPTGPLALLREVADRLGDAAADRPGAGAALHHALDLADWAHARDLVLRQCVTRDSDAAQAWAGLVRDFLQAWDHATPGLTRARKRAMLEHVLTAFSASCDGLHLRLTGLLRTWNETSGHGPSPITEPLSSPEGCRARGCASDADAGEPFDGERLLDLCRTLLAEALTVQVTRELGFPATLVREAQDLARQVREADSAAKVEALGVNLHALWAAATSAGEERWAIQQGLLRLLQLVAANVSDAVGDGSWMRGQVRALAALARGKVTLAAIADLERGLLGMAERQQVLKQSLDEAKDAMKRMVATFIERLGELASNTGEYHDRLVTYSKEIERARDIADLSHVIVAVMGDTRAVQDDLGRSREELVSARHTVETLQARTAELEAELVTMADRLQEDQLTRILNRRGLTSAFAAEASRADRHRRPLSLAMLDLDNFKQINDSLGHQGGDAVLVHFTEVVRSCLRSTDVVARYGGEEFVVLLPETALDDAMAVMRRVQDHLARRPFHHGDLRVAVTFSAGVAERVEDEPQEAVLARADRALYEAKSEGKNRLVRE